MNEEAWRRFQTVLEYWQQMKRSDVDEAGDDADLFQLSFYQFTEALRECVPSIENPPKNVEEARSHPDFAPFFDALPHPLEVPFEMELDDILGGVTRDVDSSEQS